MSDSVKKYRKRRDERVTARMDVGEEGRWVTTENKHKVHINGEGQPDKGNPHVLNKMSGGSTNYERFARKQGKNGYGVKYKPSDTVGGYSKKKPTTSDQDFEKEGYKKNSEGRWEKSGKTLSDIQKENKEYGYGPIDFNYRDPMDDLDESLRHPNDYPYMHPEERQPHIVEWKDMSMEPDEDGVVHAKDNYYRGNKEYDYGSGDDRVGKKTTKNTGAKSVEIVERPTSPTRPTFKRCSKVTDSVLSESGAEFYEKSTPNTFVWEFNGKRTAKSIATEMVNSLRKNGYDAVFTTANDYSDKPTATFSVRDPKNGNKFVDYSVYKSKDNSAPGKTYMSIDIIETY